MIELFYDYYTGSSFKVSEEKYGRLVELSKKAKKENLSKEEARFIITEVLKIK